MFEAMTTALGARLDFASGRSLSAGPMAMRIPSQGPLPER